MPAGLFVSNTFLVVHLTSIAIKYIKTVKQVFKRKSIKGSPNFLKTYNVVELMVIAYIGVNKMVIYLLKVVF